MHKTQEVLRIQYRSNHDSHLLANRSCTGSMIYLCGSQEHFCYVRLCFILNLLFFFPFSIISSFPVYIYFRLYNHVVVASRLQSGCDYALFKVSNHVYYSPVYVLITAALAFKIKHILLQSNVTLLHSHA